MDDPEFTTSTIDPNTQLILLHASNHDLPSLKPLLRIPGNASVQDPETGYTPLHAAIAACGTYDPAKPDGDEGEEAVDIQKAVAVVKELFLSGAIWNDLDANDETPGCMAWRLNWRELYELCVEAGVRAEVLLGLMGSYTSLDSDDEEEEEGEEEIGAATTPSNEANKTTTAETEEDEPKNDVNSKTYLSNPLTITNNNLLDASNNGVMMTWETTIMSETVSQLLPPSSRTPTRGPKILNIGFGLGIIDGMFASLSPPPHTHHIIEAHPDVLASLTLPTSKFSANWEASAPSKGNYKVFPGKWQDIIPPLVESGETYDAIYFDTFGESYTQLRNFFQDFVPSLLTPSSPADNIGGGRFGFFNGLGADRRVCYDVYQNVVEIDLQEVGMEVEWFEVPVPEEVWGKKEGEGEWQGVRRRYWVLERYLGPVMKVVEADYS